MTGPFRPLLGDAGAQAALERDGYVVVDLLAPDEVVGLRDLYRARAAGGGHNPPGAYDDTYAEFSIVHSTPAFRQEAFDAITAVIAPRADEHLVDCRPVVANFVNKPTGTGVVPVHQNMSLVDEAAHRSLSVWVALVDCTEANGTLEVVPGSHVLRGRRGVWAYAAFSEATDELVGRDLVPVPIRAGQAIVLDDALVHYSAPNAGDEDRLAIQLVMVPSEAEALSFEVVAEDGDELEVEELRVEPAYFWDFWEGRGDRAHAHARRRLRVPRPCVTADELRAAVAAAPQRRPRRRRVQRWARRWRSASSSKVSPSTS